MNSRPPHLTVVLCAHNPRPAHFEATLEGLRSQSMAHDDWELLLIDNCSSPLLSDQWDISWHPRGRIIVEPKLGLANSRRRAYEESSAPLIVHSDDDNILAPDYLETAWRLHLEYPAIGCFGGQLEPRFDVPPRNALERSFGGAIELDTDRWSNIFDDNRTMPFGAGMCIRREVITAYCQEVERDPRRLVLGRTGTRFITGEDIDLNHTAVRCGYGTGLFRALKLVHLIPANRMTAEHIIRYRAGNAYSMMILWYFHNGKINLPQRSQISWLMFWIRVWLRQTPFERRREIAMHRARQEAIKDMRKWGWLP